jgi:glycosyltransferase involved in cell wall biosynthesis
MESSLISFILIGCNQEKFVREAVEAAFAQTYSPLEIVLSDDCSDDRTFEVMMSLAETYRGPHHLILNKNHHRRSIGGHINQVMEISHGELIVIAAADDISLPQRTQVLYEAWEESGRKATSIHSGFIQINENGEIIKEIIKNNNHSGEGRIIKQIVDPVAFIQGIGPIVFGCTHAWTRKLFRLFGNLIEKATHEDDALAFRSILLGGLFYVGENLVKYRVHDTNMYLNIKSQKFSLKGIEQEENRNLRAIGNRETMYSGYILDLEKAWLHGYIEKSCLDKAVAEATRLQRKFSLIREFLESTFFGKCQKLYRIIREEKTRRGLKFAFARLLPQTIFALCKLAYNYVTFVLKVLLRLSTSFH